MKFCCPLNHPKAVLFNGLSLIQFYLTVSGLMDYLVLQPEQLTDLWTTAMRLPNGKSAALSSALSLLACPQPVSRSLLGRPNKSFP